jgi:hypothetical protein
MVADPVKAVDVWEATCSCGWSGAGDTAHQATQAIADHMDRIVRGVSS